MGDLVWTSVVDLARMIATKEVSPVEVTRAFLERVAALEKGPRHQIGRAHV